MKRAVWLLLLACDKREVTSSAGTVAPDVGPVTEPAAPAFDAAEVVVPSGPSRLHVAWRVPAGTDINDDAPFTVRWALSDGLVTPPNDIKGMGKDVRGGFDVPIELLAGSAGAKLGGEVGLVVCDVATHAVCVPIKRRLELTFAVSKGATPGVVTLPLPQAKP